MTLDENLILQRAHRLTVSMRGSEELEVFGVDSGAERRVGSSDDRLRSPQRVGRAVSVGALDRVHFTSTLASGSNPMIARSWIWVPDPGTGFGAPRGSTPAALTRSKTFPGILVSESAVGLGRSGRARRPQ